MMGNALKIQEATSVDDMFERMRAMLSEFVPEVELRMKAELAFEVNRLKRERNAIILGHNYMEPALYHSVPDYTGDSLQLSRVAADTDADIIVFCGVWFMGETAKVLNPSKTVLVPADKAGCSLAEGISREDVLALKERFPSAPVVSYVNTYAEVKAVSDYCCTSGNADAVVRHLISQGHNRIIFLPDEFLARNTARETGLAFIEGWNEDADTSVEGPAVIGWRARCEVHELFTPEDVDAARKQFPDAVLIAHPECSPEVIQKVDISGSTKKMVDYVRQSDVKRYMLFTECSMGDNIAAENPGKEMIRMCSHRCQHMALITLEDTVEALRKIQYKVEIPEQVIKDAKLPIDRMLSIQ